jgi:hypothetical protein
VRKLIVKTHNQVPSVVPNVTPFLHLPSCPHIDSVFENVADDQIVQGVITHELVGAKE